jgi:putative ABC transport system permease protein
VDPLGKIIRLGRVPVTVIGVLASSGTSVTGASSEDSRIVVPLETTLRRLFNAEHIETIFLQTDRASVLETATRDAGDVLRFRLEKRPDARDAFTIQNQRVVLAAELAAQRAFQRMIAGLGLLSLVVGGAGILSILLLSVRERRHEIGLRMAVGARRQDIAVQFLSEALILAGAGGVTGLGAGAALTTIVSVTTQWEAQVSWLSVGAALASAAVIGVMSGTMPARRAAALDPIQSLQAG